MIRHLSLALTLTAALLAAPSIAAQADAETEPDALEMSVDENIETPAVPKRARTYVRTAMDQLRRMLLKKGLAVETLREGEVLEVTIKCSQLFAPCALNLKQSGTELLKGLSFIVNDPRKYKVLVAVHTDDTGDEMYSDSISAARANAIDDCFWQLAGGKETNVIPYGIGRDEPRMPNDSRSNRDANRRVEIYIIPDRGLLELAGVKK